MSHAGSDAVFDFLRVCSHDLLLVFGVRPPAVAEGARPQGPRALYTRIQVASPPPGRVDRLPWEYGIRVNDGTEDGRPFSTAAGDDGWKRQGVFQVKGFPPSTSRRRTPSSSTAGSGCPRHRVTRPR